MLFGLDKNIANSLQVNFSRIIYLLVLSISLCSSLNAQVTLRDSRGNSIPDSVGRIISVDFREISLTEALIRISERGDILINFNENLVSLQKNITFSDNNKKAVDILRRILIGSGLDFVYMENKQFVVVPRSDKSGALELPQHTISGFVTDEESGEALIGANIYFDRQMTGCSTNKYGFYSITLPEGIYNPRFSFMGYLPLKAEVELTADHRIDISLQKTMIAGDTVLVTSKVESEVNKTRVGTVELVPGELATIPILFGEQDLLKTLHLLPGVSSFREGDAGLYVRGGNADQNLMLLDEAPIYNAFHFFGFFSVFNSEAIRNVKLIKGPAPARYGGRLSSVIDIHMKEGNIKKFEGMAGLGLIYSRLTLQGPFLEGRGSYVISGRRTYLDLFKYLSGDDQLLNSALYFYDLNLKVNYILNDRNRLYLSGYFGNDVINMVDIFDMVWGNKTATLRWNHLFSNNLFANTSLVISNFTHKTSVDPEDSDDDYVSVISKVNDITLKSEFQYFMDINNTLNFGAGYIRHNFLPADINVEGDTNIDIQVGKKNADEFSVYLSDEMRYWENLSLDAGLRFTMFSVKGEEDIFDINDFDEDTNVRFHSDEEETYLGFEPRFIANYMLDETSSLKFALSRNYQYMHMVSNSNSGTPWDVWQPASKNVKPMKCDQVSLGYFRDLLEEDSEYSIELFYKKMENLVDYKDGANLAYSNYFESEYVFGEGRAYGAEFFYRKRFGKLSGWLGYTLSRTERRFKEINYGEWFPAKFDRTHDFSIVLMYQADERWNFSANWSYATGNAITVPYGKYVLNGETYEAYSPRNDFRISPFHRLDLSVSYKNDVGGVWNFSLYNAYGHKNTYSVLFRERADMPGSKEAVRLSLFSMVPSVTYTLRF